MRRPRSGINKLIAYKEKVKEDIINVIISTITLEEIDLADIDKIRNDITNITTKHLGSINLTYYEKQKIIDEITEHIFGFGPIEPLLKNDSISDILINGPSSVYIEREGRLEKTNVYFKDDEYLMHVVRKLAANAGRRIDESSPIVDAYLADGSRVNAVIPPVSAFPSVSIRKFHSSISELSILVKRKMLTKKMVDLIKLCIDGKLNIIIAGSTGSGKTTLLNTIGKVIPESERIVTIEDSLELNINKSNVVSLITRPPNVEGKGEISQRNLVINALRMRPDRIIVGEIRSSEVWDMLSAMNTGHSGSMTTVHANSAEDALYRLETMAMLSGYEVSEHTLRAIISRSIDIVIYLSRYITGERRVVSISQIGQRSDGEYVIEDFYRFIPDSHTVGETIGNNFENTKNSFLPSIVEKLQGSGISRDRMNNIFLEEA